MSLTLMKINKIKIVFVYKKSSISILCTIHALELTEDKN